jgi:hypothetical protein
MSQFISWIEHEGKNYYLTGKDLETKEGRELVKYVKCNEDIKGHGAIRHYYSELKDKGIEKECEDFSTPENFPKDIVKEIKEGKFYNIGICVDILMASARAKYEKVKASARAEYWKVEASSWAEYGKVEASARAEYDKVEASARAEYWKVVAPAWAEYKKVEASARAKYEKVVASERAEYGKVVASERAEYDKVEASAWAEYHEKIHAAFWKIAIKKSNRKPIWR